MVAPRLAPPATAACCRAVLGILVGLLVLIGCGAPLAATPSPSATPEATASPAATQSPGADGVEFVSTVYPYRFTLPAAVIERDWRSARTAWDGVARMDHGSRYTDYAGADDGDLFVFGTEWPGSLQDFFELEHQNGVTYHACTQPPESTSELTVGGADAILHLQHCQGVYVAKAAVVRDGWGLVFAELIYADDEAAAVDRFKERLSGVSWPD